MVVVYSAYPMHVPIACAPARVTIPTVVVISAWSGEHETESTGMMPSGLHNGSTDSDPLVVFETYTSKPQEHATEKNN